MPYDENEPTQPVATSAPAEKPKRRFRWLWAGKVSPAFWTIASIISLTVNVILIIALIALGQQLFGLKHLVENQLLGGLYDNFVLMDKAHIRTTIPVSAEVPAKFDLPLDTTTTVTLTEDTKIANATIFELSAGPMYITRANTSIMLPAGTQLPIELHLVVPVDQKIPVNLNVNVDIPLKQTELHEPFAGLQNVVKPYVTLLGSLPNTWQEALCGESPSEFCQSMVP